MLYWSLANKKLIYQNTLLLIASYFFYGWWDYRFLTLIFISTVVDFFIAKGIHLTEKTSQKKLLLSFSLIINLGMLGFFKYYNFFMDSWINLVQGLGYQVNSTTTLSIILPVGISFYTFQTLSYTSAPFTHLYKVMVTPPDYDLIELSNFLTTLNKKKGFVIVLINYPYNFKYDIKQLSQSSLYNFFNNHNLPNLKIFQSPLITNKKESVNWRNVHPNSASMKEVFNFIQQEILNKK